MLSFGFLVLGLLVLIAIGHDERRVLQLSMLALPPLLWLLWPLQSRIWIRVRRFLVGATMLGFGLDGLIRGYLKDRYAAAPDSSIVLEAVANTTLQESLEYLQTSWVAAGLWALIAVIALAAMGTVLGRGFAGGLPAPSRGARVAIVAVMLVCSVAYLSKPWRRLHPMMFWPQWMVTVQNMRADWSEQQGVRAAKLAYAKAQSPVVLGSDPSTVVLVLTDSVNRANMSLFGYPRDTTPQLRASREALGAHWLALPNAWSTEAGTLASLRGIFGFGQTTAQGSSLHLLAMARAAGYKVWWMSNHDDVAINQSHAQLSDEVEIANRQPGRSGASLDGELLDCLEEALQDATPRKLVIVHLLGAHPHYRLRQPAQWDPFEQSGDAVDRLLTSQGRPRWLREMRRDYDEAIHYHDGIVAETLRLTRTASEVGEHRAWMYLSDHGQEVGHTTNRAGHSTNTADGYKIPAIIWRSTPGLPTQFEQRPFRADWAAWTVAGLLRLDWVGMEPNKDVLSVDYQWQPPALPVPGMRFED